MKKNSKIYIAGHKGFLGSAILSCLIKNNYKNLIFKTRKELNLMDLRSVDKFFYKNKPDIVINAAGNSGNLYQCIHKPAYLYFVNCTIQNNLFESARKYKSDNLVYFASSCIYPENAIQPIVENSFLNGRLEAATEGYAASKIAGVLACKSYNQQYYKNRCKFIALVPNTLFGPNDNFNLEYAHVFSALLKKFYIANKKNQKKIKLYGTGKPLREFIFTYNIADATIFMLKNSLRLKNQHYNIGPGTELSIRKLANLISKKTKYKGKILWDKSMPDGRKRKLLSNNLIKKVGWEPKYSFQEALDFTYNWFIKNNH